jgi:hypothetical protein
MTRHGHVGAASAAFRFRFIVRGDQAAALAALAVTSLLRCHPRTNVVIIDANDSPAFATNTLGIDADVTIVHVRPGEDPIAHAVGRGSRQHLFYWRHSPQLRGALPPSASYDAYCDCDVVFRWPLDLGSLTGPLSRGRIGATIDESTVDYYLALGAPEFAAVTARLPNAGSAGPLPQGGLLFTNPRDDGGIYDLFWDTAIETAREGLLDSLPWDDMSILATLLGHNGPLWERLLPLPHDWDFITDSRKEPGVFGRVAHYGGHLAKRFILADNAPLEAAGDGSLLPWGTVPLHGSSVGYDTPGHQLTLPLPFCLSWPVPDGVEGLAISADFHALGIGTEPTVASIIVYVDGRPSYRFACGSDKPLRESLPLPDAETISIIGIAPRPGGTIILGHPCPAAQ